MIKEFSYTSSNGTRDRKVFVIKENATYIGGLDLNLLSPEEADTIAKLYKDVVPTNDFNAKILLEGYDPAWNKAYRQFSKSKINS